MGDAFQSIDPNTMVLGLLFVIFYIFLDKLALSRIFKKERASSVIMSLCVSLLAVYGINRMNWDLSGMVFSLGVSEELLYAIVPWVILGLAVLASFAKDNTTGKRRFRLYRLFLILGTILIVLGLASLVYQRAFALIAGIVLFLIGLILWFRTKKKGSSPAPGGNGRDSLINAAKKFKSWAKSQKNPKFAGSWANFVNYLKRGRWGNSEAEICQRLGISQNEFVSIFNRYGLV